MFPGKNLTRQLVRSLSNVKSPGNYKFETAAIRRKETHNAISRQKLTKDREVIQREEDKMEFQRQVSSNNNLYATC